MAEPLLLLELEDTAEDAREGEAAEGSPRPGIGGGGGGPEKLCLYSADSLA